MADVVTDQGAPVEGQDATVAFMSGQAEVTPDEDGRVRVIDSAGKFGSVPAAELEGFLRDSGPGARIATAAERKERLLQREYGEGIANELKAAGAAALRASTLGLSDVAISAAGGDEARTALRELSARNKLADVSGAGLGVAATALATGGGGGLAKALSSTPAGLALRAGQAVTDLGVGAGAAARVGAMAAGGALEGAIFGGGQGVTDWALNPEAQERTAERLMASMRERAGEGALLGGLATGALGAGGVLLGAGARKAHGALSKLFSKADDVADLADDAAGQSLSLTSRGKAAAQSADDLTIELESGKALGSQGQSPFKQLAEGATARQKFAARQQLATTEATGAMNRLAQAADDLVSETNVGLKKAPIRKLMSADPPANLDVSRASIMNSLETVSNQLDNAIQAGRSSFDTKGIQAFARARGDMDAILGKLRNPANADELADVFIGVDQLKRRLGRIAKVAGSGANADNGAADLLKRNYGELQKLLENADVFGQGATTMQKEVNSAWTQYLEYAGKYDASFADANSMVRSARDGFEKIRTADPSKVGGALNRVGSAENAAVEEALTNGAQRHADLLETLAKHYDVTPELQAAARGARKEAQKVVSEVAELKRLRTVGDRFDETIQALKDLPFGGEQLAKAKISLGRSLNLAMETGADAEAVARNATNRVSALQRVYMASEKTARKIAESAGKYVQNMGQTGARALGAGVAMAPGSSSRAERKKRFDTAYARVSDFEHDPQAAIRRVFQTQGGLGTNAPVLASAYASKTIQAGMFLADKLPRNDPSSSMFNRKPDGSPPDASDSEVREFLEYVDAIENPTIIFDQLERGNVSPRTVEAVKAVYPLMYQDIQNEIMTKIEESEKTPPYKARLSLGILFDVPTDPALEPDFLRAVQQSAVSTAAQAQPNQPILSPSRRSAPETAGLYESKSAAAQGPL